MTLDAEVGDRVRAMQVIGDGWSKELRGEVTEIIEDPPVPHYDGVVVMVETSEDTVPVRAENVEVTDR